MNNTLMVNFLRDVGVTSYVAGEETESQDDLLGLAELTSDELKAAFRFMKSF